MKCLAACWYHCSPNGADLDVARQVSLQLPVGVVALLISIVSAIWGVGGPGEGGDLGLTAQILATGLVVRYRSCLRSLATGLVVLQETHLKQSAAARRPTEVAHLDLPEHVSDAKEPPSSEVSISSCHTKLMGFRLKRTDFNDCSTAPGASGVWSHGPRRKLRLFQVSIIEMGLGGL